ncbi:DNA polymerase III subunit gamma/tau [Desmospora profundinema]|uniref:DNA-directed DNA polymerase n=1 Tax=Desmospora profundinema TaxID=1571184 RepID=A0ABU1IKN5_9BACL|nr:DNA polymerase III subunit gamma/tau [Desmospora profundinema]MDR6225328.1 DNA polymerase-3 subunit gamma/tau [Desmospora profundinema]
MSYRALYRVWRPQTFADLIGQEHVTKTLTNALSEGHFSHAYLFSGPRGTGKTSAAKIMAKAVNCLSGPASEPCNECEACRKITEGSLMDVVEIDAASNRGVDEIRDLRDKVKYAPSEVRYKVYIVDEVHMLTTEAFNALLKTLEEPPGHVVFILATTEPHKLPPTIISRCQRFSFRRISIEVMMNRLHLICEAQEVEAEETALAAIAQTADGGMRDALSLLDQVLAFTDGKVDEESVLAVTGSASRQALAAITAGILEYQPSGCLEQVDRLLADGLDAERLIHDLIHLIRDLMLVQAAPELREARERLAGVEQLKPLTDKLSASRLGQVLERLIHTQQQMKWAAQPRILLEVALVDLTQPTSVIPADNSRVEPGAEQEREIFRLREELRQLRQQWEEWKDRRLPPQTAHSPDSGSPPVSAPSISTIKATASGPRSRSAPRVGVDVRSVMEQSHAEQLQRLKGLWPEVLGKVKERKITVHAWLIDGEPVAASKDAVVVAFRNAIHRDTTERESNKGLIQEVLKEVMGSPQRLVTVMREDLDSTPPVSDPPLAASTAPAESRRQSSDEVKAQATSDQTGDESDDPVKQAIDFFGEDMIEITD